MRCLIRVLFVVIFLAAVPEMLEAASFDCSHAQSSREKIVCATPALSAADSKLAAAYTKNREELSAAVFAGVQNDQRDWLQWLDRVCPSKNSRGDDQRACLSEQYTERLSQLTTDRVTVAGMHFYARAQFVFKAAKQKPDDSDVDSGYGYGEISWPQIDNPTPSQELWNKAVLAATVKESCCATDQHTVSSFENAVDAQGTVDGFFTLAAANARYIEVNLGNSTYGWGAAHPNTGVNAFGWWFDSGHPLQPGDVFAAKSGWQKKLAVIALAHLRKYPGPDALWKASDFGGAQALQKGVDEGVIDSGSWNLSSASLIITFGQYAVAPYAFGMPSVKILWSELKPLLAPTFQPNLLPTTIPAKR